MRASWYGIWAKSAKRRYTRARMVRIAVGAFRKGASTTHLADRSRCRPCVKASRPSVLVVARRVRWPPTRLLSGHIPSMVVNGVPPGRSSLAECRTTMMDRPESVFLKRIWNGQIERRRSLELAPLNELIQRLGFRSAIRPLVAASSGVDQAPSSGHCTSKGMEHGSDHCLWRHVWLECWRTPSEAFARVVAMTA
jgi:hypothetical protein